MRRWMPWVVGAGLLLAMAWSLTPGAPPSLPRSAEVAKAPVASPRTAPPTTPELAPTTESGRAFGRHVRRLLHAAQRTTEQPPEAEAPEPAVAAAHTEDGIDTGWYPDVVHPISADGLQEAMRTAIPGMQRCYQGALEVDRELEGRVALSFVIATDDDSEAARITETRIDQSTLGQPFMEACLLQQVAPLAFEAPAEGNVSVTYPVLFATD